MNMKKILAAASASVLAVSALSASAFAASGKITTTIKGGFVESGDILKITIQGGDTADSKVPNLDFTQVAGVNVTISYTKTDAEDWWVGGSVVFASTAAGWKQQDWKNEGAELGKTEVAVTSGKAATIKLDASPFASSDEWANIAFQNFSDNDYCVEAIDFLDKDGKVLATVSGKTDDNTQTPGGSDKNDTKDPVPTGVGGVAAVLGVAVVAAGAMIVAKKRK